MAELPVSHCSNMTHVLATESVQRRFASKTRGPSDVSLV